MTDIPPHRIYTKLALEREANFDWVEAEKYHRSAVVDLVEKGELFEAGEIQERAAYSLYRAAYQAETAEAFRGLLESASLAYGKAAEIYEGVEGPWREAKVLSNRGMEHFYSSWIIEDPSDRKTQAAHSVEMLKDALRACEESENDTSYGETFNKFLKALFALSELTFSHIEGSKIIDEALDFGSRALKTLEKGDDKHELARCYYQLSLFLPDRPMDVVESVERQKELMKLGMRYAEMAVELSEKVGDPYLIGLSLGIYSLFKIEVDGDTETAITLARRQLQIGERTRDRLILARANEYLSYYIGSWVAADEEDRDIIRTAANEGMQHADEAISHYKAILNPILTAFLARSDGPSSLAMLETDLELRKQYTRKAIEASYADLEYATESGSLLGRMYIHVLLGQNLIGLAKIERDKHEKDKLLLESARIMRKFIDSATEAQPFRHWNLSVAYNELVRLKGQLAKDENDRERKKELLLEAIADMDKSIESFNKYISVHDIAVFRENYAIALILFGEILFQMHLISDDDRYLETAIQRFDDAIETYEKTNVPSYIAEIQWKKAWVYYQNLEYSKAATEFDGSSRNYLLAGEKYPNQSSFYDDYGRYMEAWGNIARAMHHHSRDEYTQEKEFFENAVKIQMNSQRWKYLSSNYLAWARLAEAEIQSRNDQCEEAIEMFQESANLFSSAKTSIAEKFSSIGVEDEANMASELMTASDLRRDYCLGRVALEEAKILDRRGEHNSSSRKYGAAAQIFMKIIDAMETESERREIRPLHSLCLAWQKMTQAEAEASPDTYLEASTLFEKAREHSPNEKTRLLTMGHASFCRALGACIKYEVSREENLHQELIRHIGSATDFYVRAGFDSALEYSRATQRLFEAYQYMDRARSAANPSDKMKYFSMAERLLAVSADAFQKAKHPKKRDEVARLLRSLETDKEIAVSLSEILDTPEISSSTESFRVPTPSHEYPVGFASFEHADVQGKIFMTSDTFTSGEEFHLELELYNPGKTSATLARVENLFPDDFEVKSISSIYSYDDDTLDLRGKRIGPLSSIEISLRAKPISKGDYTLKPRIIYLDDTGEQRSSEPEPMTISVREMGILRWLRGADRPD